MSGTELRNAGGRWVNRSSKWLTPEKRAALYLRDDFRCVYCGELPQGLAHRTHPTAIAGPRAARPLPEHRRERTTRDAGPF